MPRLHRGVQHLVEGRLAFCLLHIVAGARAVQYRDACTALYHGLASVSFYFIHCHGALGVQHHIRRGGKQYLALGRAQLFLAHKNSTCCKACVFCSTPSPESAVRTGCCAAIHRQNIHQERTAHIHTAPAYCAAVHVFRLAAYPRMRGARVLTRKALPAL